MYTYLISVMTGGHEIDHIPLSDAATQLMG